MAAADALRMDWVCPAHAYVFLFVDGLKAA